MLESGKPDVDRALQHVDAFLDGASGKDIFLATDNNELRWVLITRYPEANLFPARI
jgi:hypothetical protein